ncbi:MAG: hypothetical protein C4320_09920 [Armatimonadota bacterium]
MKGRYQTLLGSVLATSLLMACLAGCGESGETKQDAAIKQAEMEKKLNDQQKREGKLPAGDGPAG